MTNKDTQDTQESVAHKLTYQPFILVVALVAMLVKVVISLSIGGPVVDWLFAVVVILFIAALVVYIWDRYLGKGRKQNISITTGKAEEANISGTDVHADDTTVNINTQDIRKTRIIGVESRKPNKLK